jgi:menaquinone-dependent protoporphyrinogen oxidase
MKVLVAYASKHGSTADVARFIGDVLKEHDVDVTVSGVEQVTSAAGYDAFLLGTPIYGGMWLSEMSQFIEKFEKDLSGKLNYLWMMCIRILEEGGYEHAIQNYVHQEALHKIGVKEVVAFAGKLKLDEIDWNERWTLSIHYDGQRLPGSVSDDFRDWNAIREWAKKVRGELEKVSP